MFNWLFHSTGDFAVDSMTAIGTILLCIIALAIILIAWRLTFSKVIQLITGPYFRAVRLIISGGIYIPLFVWWIMRVYAGNADIKQWAAFIALLIFLNYVPVNIVGKALNLAAENKERDCDHTGNRKALKSTEGNRKTPYMYPEK